MRRYFVWLLAFSIGFISLGQEMLWFRVTSYFYEGIPQSFAFVLTLYLLGIAVGANLGKRVCLKAKDESDILLKGGILLLLAGLFDLFLPLTISNFGGNVILYHGLIVSIFLTAFLKGGIFPIAHHLGSANVEGKVGSSVSKVYFFNIIGSTLGSIFVGAFLLNYVSTNEAFFYSGLIVLLLAVVLLISSKKTLQVSFVLSICLVVVLMNISAIKLILKVPIRANTILTVENRHGIIDLVHEKYEDSDSNRPKYHVIMGGNVYDGMMTTDVIADPNRLSRVLVLDTLHPNPKRALVIGVSGGAWTRVLSSFPSLDHIDAVEINSGYLDVISQYDEISPILIDPKITFHIDDGRRWLRRNTDKKYDLIIMNTTFYWRSGITNLLSHEMMMILSNALTEDGVLAFNSTRFKDTLYTAKSIFPYAYWGEIGFVYASKSNFLEAVKNRREKLYNLELDGQPLFVEGDPKSEEAIDKIVNMPMKTLEEIEAESDRELELITDKNMINEYKYGKSMF